MSNKSKSVIISLLKTNTFVVDTLSNILKPYKISLQQFNVLRILRGQKGNPSNLSTVQEKMINRMSNTTRIIDKLVKKNYVSRSICKENRRKIELLITSKGLEILGKIDLIFEKEESKLTDKLSPEEHDEILTLFNKINNSLKQKSI